MTRELWVVESKGLLYDWTPTSLIYHDKSAADNVVKVPPDIVKYRVVRYVPEGK